MFRQTIALPVHIQPTPSFLMKPAKTFATETMSSTFLPIIEKVDKMIAALITFQICKITSHSIINRYVLASDKALKLTDLSLKSTFLACIT